MIKIDLDISENIPKDVRDIIRRAETALLSMPSGYTSPAQFAHLASQWIQQAYYIGSMEGTAKTTAHYSDLLKNMGGVK